MYWKWPIFLLLPLLAIGEEELVPPQEPLSLSEYPTRIDQYRQKMNKYVEGKKKACRGADAEEKPSPEDKKLCLEQLKTEQKRFINNMYNLRRQYLVELHQKRLKQLEGDKAALLKSLEQSPSKKRKRRRRKR